MDSDDTDPAGAYPDDELVEVLTRAASMIDPVPDAVYVAASAAITTRHLDGELAVLVADSALPDGFAVPGVASLPVVHAVRTCTAGALGGRLLAFAGGGVQVAFEVNERGGRLDLIGQLIGGTTEECVLERVGGWQGLALDGLGRFVTIVDRPGAIRLCCRSVAGVQVRTAWVTI